MISLASIQYIRTFTYGILLSVTGKYFASLTYVPAGVVIAIILASVPPIGLALNAITPIS